MLVRKETLGLGEIQVHDDILDPSLVKQFYNYALSTEYELNEKSHENDDFRIFCKDFNNETFEDNSILGKKSRELFINFVKGNYHDYHLGRVCLNFVKYGDIQFLHTDCPLDKKEFTVLYYVNHFWDRKWGGETVFSLNKESMLTVLPKPGRFVVFDGRIEHRGGMISKLAKVPRIILAFKYKK